MYAVEATVRGLIRNKKSTTSVEEIQAAAAVVDPEIDAALSAVFYWPKDSDGQIISPVPPQVVSIANHLTAALIESQAYAHNEAGLATANPYGRYLERRGRKMLDDIVKGVTIVLGLERASPVRGSTSGKTTFETVSGFSGRGRPKGRTQLWP